MWVAASIAAHPLSMVYQPRSISVLAIRFALMAYSDEDLKLFLADFRWVFGVQMDIRSFVMSLSRQTAGKGKQGGEGSESAA